MVISSIGIMLKYVTHLTSNIYMYFCQLKQGYGSLPFTVDATPSYLPGSVHTAKSWFQVLASRQDATKHEVTRAQCWPIPSCGPLQTSAQQGSGV